MVHAPFSVFFICSLLHHCLWWSLDKLFSFSEMICQLDNVRCGLVAWLVSKHVCLNEIVQNSHSNLGGMVLVFLFLFYLLQPCTTSVFKYMSLRTTYLVQK